MFVRDDLIDENNEILILNFADGMVKISQDGVYEVEVSLDIDNFSSMLMGCVSFSRLHSLGLAEVSKEEYIEKINRVFCLDSKPMCTSYF